jgi:hypothetical protein
MLSDWLKHTFFIVDSQYKWRIHYFLLDLEVV